MGVAMKRIAVVLTFVNCFLLVFVLFWPAPTAAESVAPVLRGEVIELVDGGGKIRARFNVEPGGEVVLRLTAPDGSIRVKLGAGADGSGLLLLDDASEPGLQALAKKTGTSLTLTGNNGQKHELKP
jgi:hypothetical protein